MFEAEVLTDLLLWRWDHPFKGDNEFRENLLEDAATALRRSVAGEQLIESVPPSEMNLIAAIYYVEWSSLSSDDTDDARRRWLDHVRRSLPSCFCPQSDLPTT
jgi:hypothetical protein